MNHQLLVVLVAAAMMASAQQCGPSQCYPQSCQVLPLVDFVFLIDTSGTMSNAISGVQSGSINFINDILSETNNNYRLNAAFAIIEFARRDNYQLDPTKKVDMTTVASTILNQFQVYKPSYLQGWYETGLESIRCIANQCNVDNMNIAFRAGAKRVLLMYTDEDSDPPNYQQNSYSLGNTVQFEQVTDNDMWCPPGHALPSAYDQTPANLNAANYQLWLNEITVTAQALIKQQWSIYLLINTVDNTALTCMNFVQYGNPNLAVQQPDYTQWSASGTLSNLINQNSGWSANSLQAQVLKAGLVAKSFNVYLASNPTFVANFLSSVAGDLSQCSSCMSYQCSTTNPTVCAPAVPTCDCAGAALMTPPTNSLDKNGLCCATSQIDCNNVCNGNYLETNPCGVCTAGGATPANCVQDCANHYYLSSAPATGVSYQSLANPTSAAGYVIAPGNADLLAVLTSISAANSHWQTYGRYQGRSYCTLNYAAFASVIGGTGGCASSATASACETAFFSASSSLKAQATCQTGTLSKLPPAATDNCGQCIVNPSSPPSCVQGCDGLWYASNPKQFDTCGVCGGNNVKDDCGVCVNKGGDNSEKDNCGNCPGTGNYTTSKDSCGNYMCSPNKPACSSLCNGTSTTLQPYEQPIGLDPCGECVATTGGAGTQISPFIYRPSSCVQQCDNSWRSPTNGIVHKVNDSCGNCFIAGTAAPACVQDCAGTWGGSLTLDLCGQCGGVAVTGIACLVDCANTYYLSSQPAPNVVNNKCGQCLPANNQGAALDKCGNCLNSQTTSSPACIPVPCAPGQYYVNGTRSQYFSPCGACCANGESDTTCWSTGLTIDPNGIACGCGITLKNCNGNLVCGDQCQPLPPDSCNRTSSDPYFRHYDSSGACCNSDASCKDSSQTTRILSLTVSNVTCTSVIVAWTSAPSAHAFFVKLSINAGSGDRWIKVDSLTTINNYVTADQLISNTYYLVEVFAANSVSSDYDTAGSLVAFSTTRSEQDPTLKFGGAQPLVSFHASPGDDLQRDNDGQQTTCKLTKPVQYFLVFLIWKFWSFKRDDSGAQSAFDNQLLIANETASGQWVNLTLPLLPTGVSYRVLVYAGSNGTESVVGASTVVYVPLPEASATPTPDPSADPTGLSGGAIAGIVIMVLVLLGVGTAVAWYFRRPLHQRWLRVTEPIEMAFVDLRHSGKQGDR